MKNSEKINRLRVALTKCLLAFEEDSKISGKGWYEVRAFAKNTLKETEAK